VTDEAGLMRELRLFRRQMMVRIAWAQALSLVREEETLQQLSAQLANHMANVRRVFNELIGDDEAQSPDEQLAEYWRELWQD
ncbi:hypothetical protein PXW85_27315, partial [Klebsiella pneumoniae]|uniref:hypothetical protein n=1 Tax=Klebsiella pneumoniae TaxID=573 RepID=UPI0023816BD6